MIMSTIVIIETMVTNKMLCYIVSTKYKENMANYIHYKHDIFYEGKKHFILAKYVVDI